VSSGFGTEVPKHRERQARRVRQGLVSLKLCNISKDYGERTVLEGINADALAGSALAVVGRNGSGKSTLLRIIAGLTRPTDGEVLIEANDEKLSPTEHRNAIGLVSPDLSLYDELTALENLRFFANVRGIRRGENELKELIARVGLAGRKDEKLSSYSSGMRQRMKYAFALLHDPPILLLDEPTANLDAEGVSLVDEIIRERKAYGVVVLATNDAREAEYGDKVINLGL
jgi:heme exporter protein A